MELNYPSHAQNGKVSQSSKDSQKNWSGLLSKVMGEDSLAVAHSESTESENIKHVSSLPTVFEDRTSLKLRKFPTREQLALSNLVNLKKSDPSQDIRGEDARPPAPFFPPYSLQESLDDNENFPIRSTEVRMSHRRISSPLPSVKMIGSMRMRRRALSESPAEALISPVVPRRCLSPRELNKGVPRAISCPAITSDKNEQANQPTPSPPISPRYNFEDLSLNDAESQTRTKFVTTPTRASSQLKSADQDRLPRINQTRCGSMLVRPHKAPTESARELFNVSPVLGQSADTTIDGHNSEIQCDVADKVQYFLHTLWVEEDIDQ